MRLATWVNCLTILASSVSTEALSATPIGAESFAARPLAFTENRGQWNGQVLFQARTHGMTIWFTRDGVTYQPACRIATQNEAHGQANPILPISPMTPIRGTFENANPDPTVTGEGPMEYKCNYFLGNDPAKWRTGVPNYERIVYHDLYPGIDLAFYGMSGNIEYDFIIHPGADASPIAFRYENAQSTSIDRAGDLVLSTPWGEFKHLSPKVYQILPGGERIPALGEFCLSEDGTVRFDIPDRRDPALALVVDPVLSYSTYLGGTGADDGWAIAVDSKGYDYVTGSTVSTDFPTVGAYQSNQPGTDVFLTKLGGGNSVVYSTYLGGGADDAAYAMAVDPSYNVYITGATASDNFPTNNPYQLSQGGRDVFVVKLSEAGDALLYGTYLGGGTDDEGWAIAVDQTGQAFVGGSTLSSNFPKAKEYQSAQGGYDGFVSELSDAGDKLLYSTFLGGSGTDRVRGIAIDNLAGVYVTGYTESTNFPSVGPYQNDQPGGDAFVSKLNVAGEGLMYSTYLGGNSTDAGSCIVLGGNGQVYVAGETSSSDFPTVDPFQSAKSDLADGFVARLNASGSGLVYCTFLGGNCYDRVLAIAVDAKGYAYVTGQTCSTTFPTVDSIQADQPGYDAFVTKLLPTGNSLEFSTYLGGNDLESGNGIALDRDANAHVVGTTYSTDFPTVGPYQTDQTGADVFVFKIGPGVVAVFEPDSPSLPTTSELRQNVPNPFNAGTTIPFSLQHGGDVELTIFNMLGQQVHLHRERNLLPGTYSYRWDGTDDGGRELPTGIYLARLTTPRFTQARKMTLLK